MKISKNWDASMLNEIKTYKLEFIKTLSTINRIDLINNDHNFLHAIKSEHTALIAEIKPRSPSQGNLSEKINLIEKALAYVKGGSAAISVLTDEKYFGGSFALLKEISEITNIPLLCKDFIIDIKQIYHARLHGAAACLLIAAMLEDEELLNLKTAIEELNMLAIIEVFNADELQRVLKLNPAVIQINNRDLNTLQINSINANQLAAEIPHHITVIAASGYETRNDIKNLSPRINAVLIGGSLMRHTDPIQLIKELKGVA